MQCKAKTASGKPCRAKPIKNSAFCFIHDPSQGAKRAEARKRGGYRNRTPHAGDPESLPAQVQTLADAQRILDYTLREILPMENSLQRARVLIALFDAFAKAIEVGEFEARLAALEARVK